MRGLRAAAIPVSLVAWLYVWYLLRRVQDEYGAGDIGAIPMWLLLLLGAGTLVTIGTTVAAAMRAPVWLWLSLGAGLVMAASVLGFQYAVMNSTLDAFRRAGTDVGSASIADAFRAAIRSRGAVHLTIVIAVPLLLVLAGGTGLVARKQTVFDAGEEA